LKGYCLTGQAQE
jgi:hypothetical protein